jgi:phage tail-like protein
MKKSSYPPTEFYFELSANGEQTPFLKVEGMSTEVALEDSLKEGENPFKYRLPSMPKSGNLILKNGRAKKASKLMKWCAASMNREENTPVQRSNVALHLKDTKGRSLVEWTLHNAYPVNNNTPTQRSRSKVTLIKDLELAFSFFTVSRK